MNPTGGICTKIILLLLMCKEIYIVYSCCIYYLISCAPLPVKQSSHWLLLLDSCWLLVTHTVVRIGVTIVTHTQR